MLGPEEYLNSILVGDCLEVMKLLPDGCVDMVLTSPPYDNLRTYKGYSFDFEGVARELFRVVKPGGVVVWVVGDSTVDGSESGTSFRQALFFKDIGFRLHDTMIWDKDECGTIGSLNRYQQFFEYMFVLAKQTLGPVTLLKDRANRSAGRVAAGTVRVAGGNTVPHTSTNGCVIAPFGRRGNVWVQAPEKGRTIKHPAMFPTRLAEDHILSWSNPGDIVLDPFAGSGTTGVACINSGRNFVQIEIENSYAEIAEHRAIEAFEKLEGSSL